MQLAFVMAAASSLDSSSTSEGSLVLAAQYLEAARSAATALGERYAPLTEADSKAQVYSHILVITNHEFSSETSVYFISVVNSNFN